MSYKYITESHYNSTIWVRAIASRRSPQQTNPVLCMVFFSPWLSPLWYVHLTWVPLCSKVPLYTTLRPHAPRPPSKLPTIYFIVWNRWWHVTNYPAAAIPVNYPPTHTSTNRQTKWSYIHIFKVVFSWPIFTSLRRASGFVRIFMQAVCEK